MKNFRRELQQLINKYSKENGSDTPDFILPEYLTECLKIFNKTISLRNTWYGMGLHINKGTPLIETDYQKEASDINYNRLCARSTLYPGKSIDEIPKITAEELKKIALLSNEKTGYPENNKHYRKNKNCK